MADELVGIEGLRCQGLLAGEGKQPGGQLGGTLCPVHGVVEISDYPFVRAPQAPGHQVEAADDDCQHVVEVVRDATGQLTDRFELLQNVPKNNFVDEHVLRKLELLRIPPSVQATDAEFIRRASLDICGSLPTSAEVHAYRSDTRSDKRVSWLHKQHGGAAVLEASEAVRVEDTITILAPVTALYDYWRDPAHLLDVMCHLQSGTSSSAPDLSVEIIRGEFLVFVGPSGCGKSTLLRMIAGLEGFQSGEISIEGKVVNALHPSAAAGGRFSHASWL